MPPALRRICDNHKHAPASSCGKRRDALCSSRKRCSLARVARRQRARNVDVLSPWTPDVIVTDIGMPHEDGYEMLKQVRMRMKSPVPVIALTGYASETHRDRALAAGFFGHVSKPADPEALVKMVAAAHGDAEELPA